MKTFIGPEGLQVEIKVDGKLEWRKATVLCYQTMRGDWINAGRYDVELKEGERLIEFFGADPVIVTAYIPGAQHG